MKIVSGAEFTHDSFIDPDWTPGPGEKYRDAPKARMVVTQVKMHDVFYRYAKQTEKQRSRAAWVMNKSVFEHRYGEQFPD